MAYLWSELVFDVALVNISMRHQKKEQMFSGVVAVTTVTVIVEGNNVDQERSAWRSNTVPDVYQNDLG